MIIKYVSVLSTIFSHDLLQKAASYNTLILSLKCLFSSSSNGLPFLNYLTKSPSIITLKAHPPPTKNKLTYMSVLFYWERGPSESGMGVEGEVGRLHSDKN